MTGRHSQAKTVTGRRNESSLKHNHFHKSRHPIMLELLKRGTLDQNLEMDLPRVTDGRNGLVSSSQPRLPASPPAASAQASSRQVFPEGSPAVPVVPLPSIPSILPKAIVATPSLVSQATPSPNPTRVTPLNAAILPTPSKLSSLLSICSGLGCSGKISTSFPASSASSVPNTGSSAQQFFASLGSSPGSIFFTCLVGLAFLGVTVAIVSFALRRWCNRRRKTTIDEDTWKFLDTPKEFAKGPKIDDDALSAKDPEKSFEMESNLAIVYPTLNKHHTPSHPFTSHIQQQTQQNTIPSIPDYYGTPSFHHLIGFQPQISRRMSCFVDEKGLNWMNTAVPQSTMYGGMVLAPFGSTVDSMNSANMACTISELMLQKPSHEDSNKIHPPQLESLLSAPDAVHLTNPDQNPSPSRLAYTPSQQARWRATMFIPSTQMTPTTLTRTRSMTSSTVISRHPLAREISLAFSEQSTTVETLRERAIAENKDLRANLIGAIQRDKDGRNESSLVVPVFAS